MSLRPTNKYRPGATHLALVRVAEHHPGPALPLRLGNEAIHNLDLRLLDSEHDVYGGRQAVDDAGTSLYVSSYTHAMSTHSLVSRVGEAPAGAGLDLNSVLLRELRNRLRSQRGTALPDAPWVLAAQAEGGQCGGCSGQPTSGDRYAQKPPGRAELAQIGDHCCQLLVEPRGEYE